MRKQIVLTGAALTVLLLATVSANAISLTIGSGGLVSVDGSADSSSSVGVGVGVDVDLGGSSGSSIDVDANLDADLDVNGDANLDLFGGKKLVTTGGDNLITVDTSDDSDALITLFGSSGPGDTGVEVDLGGGGDGVSASLFGGADTGAEVTVDPFGGAEETAFISLFGTGGDSGGNAPLSATTLDLFGPSASGPTGGNGVDNTQTGSVAGTGAGASTDGAGAGDGGTGDGGVFGNGAQNLMLTPSARTRVAANAGAQARASCFSPDEQQIDNLRGRATYDGAVIASWKTASNISIVPIKLCPDARARLSAEIDADANIQYMQAAVAADARLNSALDPPYDPEDVLAVDQAGDELTIYVY